MEIQYSNRAIKNITKIPPKLKDKIRLAIEGLPNGDVKKIKGADNTYRLRVNDYRILYTIVENVILVAKIEPRGQVYKK